MKKIIKRLVIGWLVSSLLIISVLFYYSGSWESNIKKMIEEKGTQALQGPVTVEKVTLKYFPPRLELFQLKAISPAGMSAQVEQVEVAILPSIGGFINPEKKMGHLSLNIIKPLIEMETPLAALNKEAVPQVSDEPVQVPVPQFPRDFSAKVTISEGELVYKKSAKQKIEVHKLFLTLASESLRNYLFQLDSKLNVAMLGETNWSSDIELKSDEIKLDKTELSSKLFLLNLAGLHLPMSFSYDLSSAAFNATTKSDLDFEKIKLPQFLPPGKWRGVISFDVSAKKDRRSGPIDMNFDIKSPGVFGDIQMEKDNVKAGGKVSLSVNATGSASLPSVGDIKLLVKNVNFKASATQADMKMSKMFYKPVGVKTILEVLGSGNSDSFNLTKFNFLFDKMLVVGSGVVMMNKSKPSQINFKMGKTSLLGLEKYILPLSGQPVDGFVEFSANMVGDIFNFKQLDINPDLTLEIKQLKFADLIKHSPAVAEKMKSFIEGALQGTLSGQAKIKGRYNVAGGIEKSPLTMLAKVQSIIPELKLIRSKTAQGAINKDGVGAKPVSVKEEKVFPDWPIAQSAVTDFGLQINKLQYGTATMNDVRFAGSVKGPGLKGDLSITKIFSGSLLAKDITVNLSTNQPDVRINNLKITDLETDQAAQFYNPEWKDLIRGKLNMVGSAFVPNPAKEVFLNHLKSEGQVQMKDAFLSSTSLDDMINKKIAQIPGVGDKNKLNSKGIAANISTQYMLEGKTMKLKEFNFISPEKNELKANGVIGMDKSINLEGKAFLATAPVGGSLREANSDAQGRFVIPVKITGNLMNPEASFAEETVKQLLAKTVSNETDKLKSKAIKSLEDEAKKHLGDNVDKIKNDLKKLGLPF